MTATARRRADGHAAPNHLSYFFNLFAPIDAASVAVFRIMFGGILMWEVSRYFSYGWIADYFVDPTFLFHYPGFEWVTPWPGEGMYWHFGVLGVLAFLITVGLFYRVAIVLFFLGFAYVFLLEQARYLNHFYLVGLIAFLMMFVPASRVWSVDALIARKGQPRPIPAWTLLILVAQVEIMYIYAGVMKIDRDWLQGQPLGEWLTRAAENLPLMAPLLTNETAALLGAYGSIALHLIGAPLLLLRATRLYVFIVYCIFHGLNALLWNIGIFPWFTMAATLLFFPPDWPRQLWRRLVQGVRGVAPAFTTGDAPILAVPAWPVRVAVTSFVALWIAGQILVPLRFFYYPGFVSWHEQGHQFSWQMMLRTKSGVVRFVVRDPATGQTWQVDPEEFIDARQVRKMATHPEMIRQFAHHLERVWIRDHATKDVEVRVHSAVSLNGRPSQPLIDPSRDLTKVAFSLRPHDWVLPWPGPLPPREQRWQDDFDATLERLAETAKAVETGATTPAATTPAA